MQTVNFRCPACAIPLRLRDQKFLGRCIDCPECKTGLLIENDRNGGLKCVLACVSEQQSDHTAGLVMDAGTATTNALMDLSGSGSVVRNRQSLIKMPQATAWLVAGVLTLTLLWLFFSGGPTSARQSLEASQAAVVRDDSSSSGTGAAQLGIDSSGTSPGPDREMPTPDLETPSPDSSAPDESPPPADAVHVTSIVVPEIPPRGASPTPVNPQLEPDSEVASAEAVRLKLAQPVLIYEQFEPVPLRDLVDQLAEMAAVSVEYDDAVGLSARTAEFSLSVEKTTVGEILDALLHKARLRSELQPGMIVIRQASAADDSNRDEQN